MTIKQYFAFNAEHLDRFVRYLQTFPKRLGMPPVTCRGTKVVTDQTCRTRGKAPQVFSEERAKSNLREPALNPMTSVLLPIVVIL
jgi:hypothetical protein